MRVVGEVGPIGRALRVTRGVPHEREVSILSGNLVVTTFSPGEAKAFALLLLAAAENE